MKSLVFVSVYIFSIFTGYECQGQNQVQGNYNINRNNLLGLASSLQNLAGNILTNLQQGNPVDIQFSTNFGGNINDQNYQRNQQYPSRYQQTGPPGHGHGPPPGPPGPPPPGPPPPGPPPPGPPPPPGYGPAGPPPFGPPPHQNPRHPGHGRPGQNQPLQRPDTREDDSDRPVFDTNEDEDRQKISGYINGDFPVILLEKNEIR